MRRHKPRVSNFAAGIIAAVVIAAVCYVVFGGGLPSLSSPYVLKAQFTSQTQLHIPSPVRMAGVDVGQVTAVTRIKDSNAAVITMQINSNGLPIHADATATIRARIFLEGNFYIDLRPGSPTAPTLHSGSTLPAANTSGPVQLDRVLSALNSDARANLQTLLIGLGATLSGQPTAAQDVTQDPSVRGLTAAQALNLSLKYSADAFKTSAIVNQALLGTQPHDLNKVVIGNSQVFRGLAASGDSLSSFVRTFNATMATFASRQQQLSQTIALLPPFLRATQAANTALDQSFGPTQTFATEITQSPGLDQLNKTITLALPWLAQATKLVGPDYLGGLLNSLSPAIVNTASSLNATKTLLSQANQLALCFSHNIIPAGNEVILDPPASTGEQVYQELFQGAVGLAGASQNFDGNGRYVRSSAGGGSIQVQTRSLPQIGPLYANAVLQPLGTRPAFAGSPPPLNRSRPCHENPLPNLNNVKTGGAP
jgi:ABC-type transporter Mla subunit MlaD